MHFKGVLFMDFCQLNEYFIGHDNFLILTHKSPDGDTLGSGFALCNYLRDMGKKVNVLNTEKFPDRYSFLYKGYYNQDFEPKCVVAVDIADVQLLGSNLAEFAEDGKIDVCIDHHISNKKFGRHNYVDADASATALIIFEFLKFINAKITDQIARCLYTGISTDTGCFRFENTTPKAHLAAAELMVHDIDFSKINRMMFDVKSKGRLMAEKKVLETMEYFFDDKCAVIVLSTELMNSCKIEAAEFEGMASIPLSTEGVVIGITIKQRHEDVYKISVRTSDCVDASEFCRFFGGGGHIRAAGCEISGTLDEVKASLLDRVNVIIGSIDG